MLSLKRIENILRRNYINCIGRKSKSYVLGIETSCDDTGCAIVSTDSELVGEALISQQLVHLRNGGIIPPVAQNLHLENIESVVNKDLSQAKMEVENVDAIAVTIKPGLPLSLAVGLKYAKYLCKKFKKPLIPIHHMEAHALTVRMVNKTVQFPFLTLLISGGHCLLCFVEDVNKFYLLGESIDDAPGEAFDKTARRMKLRNINEFSKLSGGHAIELASQRASVGTFDFPLPLSNYRDCNFSFTGLKNSVMKKLLEKEKEHAIVGDSVIPEVNELCSSFQLAVARHICHRTQRAMEFIELKKLLNSEKQLIVSGGVACNNFIYNCLEKICEEYGYKCIRPPPHLCTDNGVMIAWNGIEKLQHQIDIITHLEEIDELDIESTSPLGISWIEDVKKAEIHTKAVKIKDLVF